MRITVDKNNIGAPKMSDNCSFDQYNSIAILEVSILLPVKLSLLIS